MSDDDETLRLRRELADAKVEQIQARLAELRTTLPDLTTTAAQAAIQQAQVQLASVSASHPEMATTTQDILQQVQARLAAAAQSGNPPMVTMSPLASAQAQESLRQIMGRFGMAAYAPGLAAPATPPPPDLPLSAPPRHVPVAYRLLLLPWSTWVVFSMFMIAVAPIAVWIFLPVAGAVTGVAVLAGVLGLALRRYVRLMGMLRWGQVATVVQAAPLDVGTYYSGTTYSGTTYQNMRLPVAHGWQVARTFYSGPGTKTKVTYQANGTQGELTLRGREYVDGVILVNSRRPSVAMCVTAIPFDLSERTPSGDWTGRVRTLTKLGALAMVLWVLGWTAAMLLLWGPNALWQ